MKASLNNILTSALMAFLGIFFPAIYFIMNHIYDATVPLLLTFIIVMMGILLIYAGVGNVYLLMKARRVKTEDMKEMMFKVKKGEELHIVDDLDD